MRLGEDQIVAGGLQENEVEIKQLRAERMPMPTFAWRPWMGRATSKWEQTIRS